MKRIFIFLIGMFMTMQLEAKNFSGIVFWQYNKKDTYYSVIRKDYKELLSCKRESYFLSFDKCEKYDPETLEFIFPEDEIMSDKVQLQEMEKGNTYFSIVINDQLIFTGLNRIGYFGANMLEEDILSQLYICWVGHNLKRLKLTSDYTAAYSNYLNQEDDLNKINCSKINEYFLLRGKK